MPRNVVHIRLELGTMVRGIWCNACMTGAGFAVPLNQLTPVGVTTVTHAYGCTTCRVTGPGRLDL